MLTTQFHSYAVVVTGFILAVFLGVFVNTIHAQGTNTCHTIRSGDNVPAGFGAPYNLFSETRGLLISTTDCNSNFIAMEFGDDLLSTFVYRDMYYWSSNNQWVPVRLEGDIPRGEWFQSAAVGGVPLQAGVRMWVIALTCHYVNGEWKCGCINQACTQRNWQAQILMPPR